METLSLSAQVKLLRVLEDGVVQPLGTDAYRAADVRLVCTTKVELRELVREGKMREDFFHRVVVVTLVVPPLRERPEDIPALVSYFLRQSSNRNEAPVPRLPADTLDRMGGYHWPGNVRELKHAVERMVITARDGEAGPLDLDDPSWASRMLSVPPTAGRLRDALEQTEETVIDAALRENRGEVVATARALGISRRALYERMKKYGRHKEDYRG